MNLGAETVLKSKFKMIYLKKLMHHSL